MRRNAGFSVKEEGVGGMAVVVPRAKEGVGGAVGSSVRSDVFSRNGKAYLQSVRMVQGNSSL